MNRASGRPAGFPKGLPSVAIAIVSYNTREKTLACLESLDLGGDRSVSVVVVDNASADGSSDAVRERFPSVTVVDAGENLGFARAVNLAAEHSTAEYLLLLNPDTVVLPGSIEALVSFAEAHPRFGVYGGRTLRPDGAVEPSSCWGEPTLWSLVSFALGLSTAFKGSRLFDPEALGGWQRDTVREVPIITGCLLMMRLEEFRALGGMDERFFLYGEDAEFSVRARKHGHRPVIVPDAVIVHEVGASTRETGNKMSMVMAGKATLLSTAWPPLRGRLGIALLQLGALTRSVLEQVSGRSTRMWTSVWRRRKDWRRGYPHARAALFGAAVQHERRAS